MFPSKNLTIAIQPEVSSWSQDRLEFAARSRSLIGYGLGRKNQMSTLTLVVDDRELSTIRGALLLLQKQVDMLPEDLAEMMREHGPAMTETETGQLSSRLGQRREESEDHFGEECSRMEALAEIERFSRAAFIPKPGNGLSA
jgi:hypothetical protein